MALLKMTQFVLLLATLFFVQGPKMSAGYPALSFGSWPTSLDDAQSAITKGMATAQSNFDTGINLFKTPLTNANLGFIPSTASTMNAKAFEQGGKMRDQAFSTLKGIAGTSGVSTSTQTTKSVTSTTDSSGNTVKTSSESVSKTVNDGSSNVKSGSDSVTKSVSDVPATVSTSTTTKTTST